MRRPRAVSVAVWRSRVPVWGDPVSARVLVPLLEPLEPHALEVAAEELLVSAGRPEGWAIASEYEREAWRVATRRVILAYLCASAFTTPADHREERKA